MTKKILDACCSAKFFWFNKEHPDTTFVDIREGDFSKYGRTVIVKPDVVADFRNLPFDNETFFHVVLDPPHLLHAGDSGWMKAKYGVLNRETWQDDIRKGFSECWRVLKPNGTLVFKWSEADIKLSEILKLAPALQRRRRNYDCIKIISHYKNKPIPRQNQEKRGR